MTKQPVYEIVVFKAKDGVTPEQMVSAAEGVQALLSNYEGYISRQLIHTEDSQWVDLVTWESIETAHAAAEDIMKQPAGQAFGAVIDFSTVNMMHGTAIFAPETA